MGHQRRFVGALAVALAFGAGAMTEHWGRHSMGRGSSYSPEEDAIILNTAGKKEEEVNALLEEAGFPTRGANALKKRRQYLRTRQAHSGIVALVGREQQLREQEAELEARLASVRSEHGRLVKQIAEHYNEMVE